MLNVTAENFTMILARLRQNMLLECSDTLPPGTPVSWEFNSTPLPPSDKHVITTNGSLLVRNVQLEDMGEYQCVVDGVRLTRELVIEGVGRRGEWRGEGGEGREGGERERRGGREGRGRRGKEGEGRGEGRGRGGEGKGREGRKEGGRCAQRCF